MKLKALKDFRGSENGLDTHSYKKNEIIETVNKQYIDMLVNGGYAKLEENEPKASKSKTKTTKKNAEKKE